MDSERALADVGVEFEACWAAAVPDGPIGWPAATDPFGGPAVGERRVPWRMAFDGRDLRVTVGPVPLARRAMRDAMAVFRRVHASTGLSLGARSRPGSGDGADSEASGESTVVRVTVGEPPPVDVRSVVREAVARPLARLLGDEALGRFDVRAEDRTVALELGQPLLPEVAARVLPLIAGIAGIAGAVLPEPAGDVDELLRVARSRLVGVVSRAGLDVITAFVEPPTRSEAVTSEYAAAAVGPPEFGPLRVRPFRPGARPIDEADRPGAGCSEAVGLVGSASGDDEDTLWILFGLDRDDYGTEPPVVRMSASFVPAAGSALPVPVAVPGLTDVEVPAAHVSARPDPRRLLEPVSYEPGDPASYVAVITPRRDLLPNPDGWSWDEVDPALRDATPDGQDPFTFAHQFRQRLRVDLALDVHGTTAASASTEIDVFDVDRFGSLYGRLITQLVRADTQRQAAERGLRRVYQAYHPWYPVLAIGLNKARLYMRAVREDITLQQRNLADPGWLMRVGLYLELLTCLGIIEATRDDYPNLLTPAEYECFERSPAYADIRDAIDPQAWREVWTHREIVFASNPVTAAGPVDFRNLLRKEAANLAFLHAHHEDLKRAIELAGPNQASSQQTWHRVFRDAERAVLDASQDVFPEFRHLGAGPYSFVLWHQRDELTVQSGGLLPSWLTSAFGDRDGLYPTAARRYRASMNEVAEWARQRGLMGHAGEECIPRSASLIEARLDGEDERFAMLQAADGYGPPLQATRQYLLGATMDGILGADVPKDRVEVVASLLRTIKIFEPLTVSELWRLAYQGERREFGPGEAVLTREQPAPGLFVVQRGTVEVLALQADDSELPVDRMGPGDVFGEYSLLTGHESAATMRAVDEVVVHTIPRSAMQPIIEARPEVVVELSVLLAARRGYRQSRSDAYLFGSSEPPNSGMVARLISRMRDHLLA